MSSYLTSALRMHPRKDSPERPVRRCRVGQTRTGESLGWDSGRRFVEE